MDKLKTARRLAGLSQDEAARRLKTATKTIARWESGETNGWMGRVDDLARIYGTTREALLPENLGPRPASSQAALMGLEEEVARLRREVEELRALVVRQLARQVA
jgi:transcriptional regulator with XRE-family HTH domain